MYLSDYRLMLSRYHVVYSKESVYVNVNVSLTLNNAHIVSLINRVCLGVNSCSRGTIPMCKKTYIVKSV